MNKLMEIQNELKAPKDLVNSFGGYKYRSCESILEALKPLLYKHSLTLTLKDEMIAVGNRVYVKATAELLDGTTPIAVITASAREEESKKGMDGSQITGAASSYARKYALNGLFLIDDNKDSDATNDHDNIKAKAESARAKYREEEQAKGGVELNPKHQHVPLPDNKPATGASGPSKEGGKKVYGLILYALPPNKGGFRSYGVDGQQKENGKDVLFSTNSDKYMAVLGSCIQGEIPAEIEYVDNENPNFAKNIVHVELYKGDKVPF